VRAGLSKLFLEVVVPGFKLADDSGPLCQTLMKPVVLPLKGDDPQAQPGPGKDEPGQPEDSGQTGGKLLPNPPHGEAQTLKPSWLLNLTGDKRLQTEPRGVVKGLELDAVGPTAMPRGPGGFPTDYASDRHGPFFAWKGERHRQRLSDPDTIRCDEQVQAL